MKLVIDSPLEVLIQSIGYVSDPPEQGSRASYVTATAAPELIRKSPASRTTAAGANGKLDVCLRDVAKIL